MKNLTATFALAAALLTGTGAALAQDTSIDNTITDDAAVMTAQQQEPEPMVPDLIFFDEPTWVDTPQGPVLTDRMPNVRVADVCATNAAGQTVTFELGYYIGLSQPDLARDGETIQEFLEDHSDEITAGFDAVWEAAVNKHGFDAVVNGSQAFSNDLAAGLAAFRAQFEQDTGVTMGMAVLGARGVDGCAEADHDHSAQTPAVNAPGLKP